MKYKEKARRCYRYKKLIWDDKLDIFGYRNYHYEDKFSIAVYGPAFRFRYDPVPGIKHYKNSIVDHYRHPRTTQEKRYYHVHAEFTRSKRAPRYLIDWYDDVPHARREKGWKRAKKRRQWMKGINKDKSFSLKYLHTEELN